jgi:hypothetical protein
MEQQKLKWERIHAGYRAESGCPAYATYFLENRFNHQIGEKRWLLTYQVWTNGATKTIDWFPSLEDAQKAAQETANFEDESL